MKPENETSEFGTVTALMIRAMPEGGFVISAPSRVPYIESRELVALSTFPEVLDWLKDAQSDEVEDGPFFVQIRG